jgi:solute carrier family 25 protein 16
MAENPENTTAPAAADRVRSKERTNDSTIKDVKAIDKRSLDYVLRSGLAGGLAGCAVGSPSILEIDRDANLTSMACRLKLSLLPLIE